jgi:hypothetical protein
MVTGGRDYADKDRVYEVLDQAHAENPIGKLIHGKAKSGADVLANEWAEERGVSVKPFPADWNRYKKAAGVIRNQEMVNFGPDIVIAFPGGTGTADAMRRARLRRIPVIEVTKDRIIRRMQTEYLI